jgi:ribosomal protein S18 acetylase RimI-like enzyme
LSSSLQNHAVAQTVCRMAEPSDAPDVAAILVQAFTGLLSSLFGTRDAAALTAVMTAAIENGSIRPETLLIAEADGNIAGTAILQDGKPITAGTLRSFYGAVQRRCGPVRAAFGVIGALTYRLFDRRSPFYSHLLYIEAIAVNEAVRGIGIGTELLHAAERRAAQMGKTHMGLHVIRSRQRARELYLRLGYSRVVKIPVAPIGTYLVRWLGSRDVWYMEKQVTCLPQPPTPPVL